MRIVTSLLLGSMVVAAAAPAFAEEQMSDHKFLQAAKCRALTAASGGSTTDIDAILTESRAMRDPAVLRSAQNILSKPVTGDAAKIAAQRDAQCKPFAAK